MKNIAVICEYNPFHNGHYEQIKLIRERFGECRMIALMSGSFVQRGIPAVYGKYVRAEAALSCGCDLVLELPAPYAFGSAEFFASGAVKTLEKLGGIDVLCFGSECGDIDLLSSIAENVSRDEYKNALKALSDEDSHIRSADSLYAEMFGSHLPDKPNDILAAEYISALKKANSGTVPFTYPRTSGFSASKTRNTLISGGDTSDMIPPAAKAVFDGHKVTDYRIYSALALYKLSATDEKTLSGFFGMNGGVAGCIKNRLPEADTLDKLVSLCTSRKYTAARIRRAVLCSLLGVTGSDMRAEPSYTVLLGSNARGREYLSEIRRTSAVEIVTKPADAPGLPGYEITSKADALLSVCRGEKICDAVKTKPAMIG